MREKEFHEIIKPYPLLALQSGYVKEQFWFFSVRVLDDQGLLKNLKAEDPRQDWGKVIALLKIALKKAKSITPPPLNSIPDPGKDILEMLKKIKQGNLKSKFLELGELSKHPESQKLPINPFSNENGEPEYKKFQKDYTILSDSTSEGKYDFNTTKYKSPNVGWKLHLNVRPENVVYVSTYLKSQGYCHKYLDGGAVEDGKIFTIYVGSRKKALYESSIISKKLKQYLCKPQDHNEVELALGVIGRFVIEGVSKLGFNKYGTWGFVLINWDIFLSQKGTDLIQFYELQKKEQEKLIVELRWESFLKLAGEFGDYFLG